MEKKYNEKQAGLAKSVNNNNPRNEKKKTKLFTLKLKQPYQIHNNDDSIHVHTATLFNYLNMFAKAMNFHLPSEMV